MYNNIKKCPCIMFIFRRPSVHFYAGKMNTVEATEVTVSRCSMATKEPEEVTPYELANCASGISHAAEGLVGVV